MVMNLSVMDGIASMEYLLTNGIQILIDSDNPERYISRSKFTDLVSKLAGSFGGIACVFAANDV